MRVLHVTPSHARRDGGPSEVLRGLIPELSARGVEVTVLSTDKGVAPDDDDLATLCRLVTVRSRRPRGWNFAPRAINELRHLVPHVDVVHIHSVTSFTTTAAMIISRMNKVPYILEPHGALDRYHLDQGEAKKLLYNKIIDAWGFDGLDAAIYSSSREAFEASSTLSAPAIVIPLGVDEELFAPDPPNNLQPRVLFLGRLTKKKRVDLVIRALGIPALVDLGARLDVAGPLDPNLDYDPVDLARDVGVAERTHFHGRADRTQRHALLAAADVFVLASEDESFGVAVAEAMAAGCAVVASRNVGLAQGAAAEGALTLTGLSAPEVGDAILRSIEDRDRLGAAARAYAAEHFRWSAAAARLVDVYSKVGRGTRA